MFTSNNLKYSIYQIESRQKWEEEKKQIAHVRACAIIIIKELYLLFAGVVEALRAHIAHEIIFEDHSDANI